MILNMTMSININTLQEMTVSEITQGNLLKCTQNMSWLCNGLAGMYSESILAPSTVYLNPVWTLLPTFEYLMHIYHIKCGMQPTLEVLILCRHQTPQTNIDIFPWHVLCHRQYDISHDPEAYSFDCHKLYMNNLIQHLFLYISS